jgi:general stress protein 26
MRQSKQRRHNKNTGLQHQKTKWDIFTYSGKETSKITKLFKEAQIQVAFRKRNTIQNTVTHHSQIDK